MLFPILGVMPLLRPLAVAKLKLGACGAPKLKPPCVTFSPTVVVAVVEEDRDDALGKSGVALCT